jgi:ketosteroid isomerase-like protein
MKMENKMRIGLLTLCVLSLLFACNPKTSQPVATVIDKEQIKKEIQAREDEYASVYNSGELKNIGYYADDAISYFQHQEPLVGKAAIVEFLKSDLSGNYDKISFETKEVFAANDGKYVLEIGYYKVVDSAKNLVNTGNYMSLFEKRDGKYVCLRDMSASDMPLE